MTSPDLVRLREEFDAMLRRANLRPPPDYYLGALDNYAEMRRLAAVVRQAFEPEDEPACVFKVHSTVLEKGDAP